MALGTRATGAGPPGAALARMASAATESRGYIAYILRCFIKSEEEIQGKLKT